MAIFCRHEHVEKITSLGQVRPVAVICNDCGADLPVPGVRHTVTYPQAARTFPAVLPPPDTTPPMKPVPVETTVADLCDLLEELG